MSELNPDPSIPLVDLLAFRLNAPERWWLRIGAAQLVLGKDQFLDAMASSSNITLHDTPLQWLRAECEGACPLDLADSYQDAAHTRAHLTGLVAAA